MLFHNYNDYCIRFLQLISESYSPVQLDIATLKAISFNEVIIVNNPPLKPRYYKSVLPDVSITQCTVCHKVRIIYVTLLTRFLRKLYNFKIWKFNYELIAFRHPLKTVSM